MLKPCPFCGNKSQIHILTILVADWFQTGCQICGATSGIKDTEEESELAWNTRVEDKELLT